MQDHNSQAESDDRRAGTDGGRTSPPSDGTDDGRTSPPSDGTDDGRTSPPSDGTDDDRTSPPSDGTDDGRTSPPSARTDGGVAEREADVDYLDTEINILKPKTPFMRDHLKQVWAGFVAWTILTWGPVTATFLAPELMTQEIPVLQFPAHYFTVAFVAPTSSLVLAYIYTRRRDRLDEKYGIDHSTPAASEPEGSSPEDGAAVSDGGEAE